MKILTTQWRLQLAVFFAWQISAGPCAFAETMRTIDATEADPRLRMVIGDAAYCLPGDTTKVQWSPDGKWILANLMNVDSVALINVQSGLMEKQLLVDGKQWAVSARGDVFIGMTGRFPNVHVVGWKFPTLEKLWEIPVKGRSDGIAISSDGALAAVLYASDLRAPQSSPRGYVQLVDTATAKEIAKVPLSRKQNSHSGDSMRFVQGDKYLAISFSTGERALEFIDIESQKEVTDEFVAGHEEDVDHTNAILSPRGDAVLFVSGDEFSAWHVDRKAPPERLVSDSADGIDLQNMLRHGDFSPDGRRVAIASCDGCRVYNTETGLLVRKTEAGAQNVYFSPDGKTLLLIDGVRLRLVSTETWEQTERATVVKNELSKIAVQQKGSLIAATDCSAIYIWDSKDGHLVANLPKPEKDLCIEMLHFHPNDRYLLCGDGKKMWAWDLEGVAAGPDGPATSARSAVFVSWKEMPRTIHAFEADFAPDGRRALVVRQKRAWLLDMDPDPTVKPLKTREVTLGNLDELDWLGLIKLSPQGDWAFLGAGVKRRVYNLNPDSVRTELKEAFGGVAFSADGKRLVYTTSKDNMELCSLPDGQVETVLSIKDEPDRGYKYPGIKAFSPDSKYLAVCMRDNMTPWDGFYLWQMESFKKLNRVETHSCHAKQIAFGDDGHTIVTLNSNNTISVWNADALVREESK